MPVGVVSAKYTTAATAASDIKLTVEEDTTYILSASTTENAINALTTYPTSVKFVKGTEVPAGLTSTTELQTTQSTGKIGLFQDGTTVYIAPMSDTSPANNSTEIFADEACNNLLAAESTNSEKDVLETVDLSNLNTSNATNMANMFKCRKALKSIDLSGLDTQKVTNMGDMFYQCYALETITFGGKFNTSKVTKMSDMFNECSKLATINNLDSFDTSAVTTMEGMFRQCAKLTSLNLKSFNTSKVTSMKSMFRACSTLKTIYVSADFVTTSLNSSGKTYMFTDCSALEGGAGTTYASKGVATAIYACIDGGPDSSTPGYFTSAS